VPDDTTAEVPTRRLIAECYPDASVRRSFEGTGALVSTAKAPSYSGKPESSWRDG